MGSIKEIIEDVEELGLEIAGKAIPIVGIIRGFLFKRYTKKNIAYLQERLKQIQIDLSKISEEQERNLVFRVGQVLDNACRERNLEKIDIFANVITNGVISGAIIEDDEEMDIILDAVDKLTITDIEFMEVFHKISFVEGKHPWYREFESSVFEDDFTNQKENKNHSGFNLGSLPTLKRCVAYGLINEKLDKEEDWRANKTLDRFNVVGKVDPPKQYDYKMKYMVSEFYLRLREYILDKNEILA